MFDSKTGNDGLFVSGSYISDLKTKAPSDVGAIQIDNSPPQLRNQFNDAFQVCGLGRMIFQKDQCWLKMSTLKSNTLITYSQYLEKIAELKKFKVNHSSHVTLRFSKDILTLAREEYAELGKNSGFWQIHYSMVSNIEHELNAGVDVFMNDPNLLEFWLGLRYPKQSMNITNIGFENPAYLKILKFLYMVLKPVYIDFLRKFLT